MASSSNQSKLASIKAVSENYPLRGSLAIIYPLGADSSEEVLQQQGPSAGTVWVGAEPFSETCDDNWGMKS
jgi:predicted lysophospholipase L1 biosynthesis ABC-type transport system permease subunit